MNYKEMNLLPGKSRELEIDKIKEKIEDLKKRLPAHSVKPAMIEELEELEEKLAELLTKE